MAEATVYDLTKKNEALLAEIEDKDSTISSLQASNQQLSSQLEQFQRQADSAIKDVKANAYDANATKDKTIERLQSQLMGQSSVVRTVCDVLGIDLEKENLSFDDLNQKLLDKMAP